MARPKDPNKKVPLSIRLIPALRDLVKKVADEDDRFNSRSDLVAQAIEQFISQSPS